MGKRLWEHLPQRNQLCKYGYPNLSQLLTLHLYINKQKKRWIQRESPKLWHWKRDWVTDTHHHRTWFDFGEWFNSFFFVFSCFFATRAFLGFWRKQVSRVSLTGLCPRTFISLCFFGKEKKKIYENKCGISTLDWFFKIYENKCPFGLIF